VLLVGGSDGTVEIGVLDGWLVDVVGNRSATEDVAGAAVEEEPALVVVSCRGGPSGVGEAGVQPVRRAASATTAPRTFGGAEGLNCMRNHRTSVCQDGREA
jgi:hypothetical protein